MKIILDNGHGRETPGKRSPSGLCDPQILEWEYTRLLVRRMHELGTDLGIDVVILVPEDNDVSLAERCRRVNKIAQVAGKKNCLLVSVHLNAANTPKARGWEVHTYLGQNISDVYATVFWNEAKATRLFTMRGDHSDKDPDWDSNFAMLRDTICPAVLTENGFMTNAEDCQLLNSKEGFDSIVDIHLKAIQKVIEL